MVQISLLYVLSSLTLAYATIVSENSNACVDSCTSTFEPQFNIDLTKGKYHTRDRSLVEIFSENNNLNLNDVDECTKNVVLRIPYYTLEMNTIVKIELKLGLNVNGTSFHIGNSEFNDLNGGDRSHLGYDAELYGSENNLYVYRSSAALCDHAANDLEVVKNILLFNETNNFYGNNQTIVLYVSNQWIRFDNLKKKTSQSFSNQFLFNFFKQDLNNSCENLNETDQKYLYIGINRAIGNRSIIGSGVCSANISFMNCHSNDVPNMDINIKDMTFQSNNNDSLKWVHELDYLEPTLEHAPCSGEGVLQLKYDPFGKRKIARFDLNFGEKITGFTFNIGDSPTNNAYGGDSGSTSNSAEVHSNDNRFYVWLNPKYCGDTLLHRIDYNVFKPNDHVTIFVSDQRIEITNNRDYHEVLQNEYLYNLNHQNVTCNCFDTRCYPGVSADDDLYIGINRVVGGTYRPGRGLCRTRISWLYCENRIKRVSDDANELSEMIEDTFVRTIEEQFVKEIMQKPPVDVLSLLINSSIHIEAQTTEEVQTTTTTTTATTVTTTITSPIELTTEEKINEIVNGTIATTLVDQSTTQTNLTQVLDAVDNTTISSVTTDSVYSELSDVMSHSELEALLNETIPLV